MCTGYSMIKQSQINERVKFFKGASRTTSVRTEPWFYVNRVCRGFINHARCVHTLVQFDS